MKINIDPNKLRSATNAAIKLGQKKRRREEAEEKAKIAKQQQRFQEEAEEIIAAIPDWCEQRAAEGKSEAKIMRLKHGRDFNYVGGNSNTVPPLSGVGELVRKALVDSNIKYSIRPWHDGVGIDGGFDLCIEW